MQQPVKKAEWRRAIHSIVGGSAFSQLHPRARHAGMAELHDEHGAWFRQSNVVGIGLGQKLRRGVFAGRALQVFVRRKRPLSTLEPSLQVPGEIDGRPLGIQAKLPVDVREVGEQRTESFMVVSRPALPGYNVGDESGASGTIGCVVRDRVSGALLGLSCAHVLAPDGAARGATIYVPSLSEAEDRGVLGEAEMGTLARVAPMGFTLADGATNVDAATFAPTRPDDLSARVATLGTKPAGVRRTVAEGVRVRKIGSISGETHGTVQTTVCTVKMPVSDASGMTREALFLDQIGVTRFTDAGDSGALVLDESNRAVGLHFFATDALSVCQPVQRVLDALECDLA